MWAIVHEVKVILSLILQISDYLDSMILLGRMFTALGLHVYLLIALIFEGLSYKLTTPINLENHYISS